MNTANLQLQGTLIALYALLRAIKAKGVLNQQEIEDALAEAEATALAAGVERDELSRANAEAICFPIRFLQEANSASTELEDFSRITQLVAEKSKLRG
jgi:hypothetical protein